MYIFLTILFSLGLGYSIGVKRERRKYIVIDDESDNEDETMVIKPEKKSILNRIGRSIKRNLF